MITVYDLNDNPHIMHGKLSIKKSLNSDIVLEAELTKGSVTATLLDLDRLWEIEFDHIRYVIVIIDKITEGRSFYVEVKAVSKALFELSNQVLHESFTGKQDANIIYTKLFEGTSYRVSFEASKQFARLNDFGGGMYKIDAFKKSLEAFNCEYEIVGDVVYLKDKIGVDSNYMYSYRINVADVKKSTSATELKTYVLGYADYNEQKVTYTKANIIEKYVSPLQAIIGRQYEALPVKLPEEKSREDLKAEMKKVVDGTLSLAFSATLLDLRKHGNTDVIPKLGDRTFINDDRLSELIDIRVYTITEYYDAFGNMYDCVVDFGDYAPSDRSLMQSRSVERTVAGWVNGTTSIPFAALDTVSKTMVTTIQSVSNELTFDERGITATDKANANNVMRITSAGWYLSTDGGKTAKTAATANGIVADAITTGTMVADRIMGGVLRDFYGNFEWNLGTGRFYIGSSSLVYRNPGNAIVYGSKGLSTGVLFTEESSTGTPTIAIGTSINSGTSDDPRLASNNDSFSGLRAFSKSSLGNSAELVGDKLYFRNTTNPSATSTAIRMDFSENSATLGFINGTSFRINATELKGTGSDALAFSSSGEMLITAGGKTFKMSELMAKAGI